MNRVWPQYRMMRLALLPLLLVCSTSLLHANGRQEFDSSSDTCTQELMNLANQIEMLDPNDESDATVAQAESLATQVQAKAQQCLALTTSNQVGENTGQEPNDAANNIMNSGVPDSGPSVQSQLDSVVDNALASSSNRSPASIASPTDSTGSQPYSNVGMVRVLTEVNSPKKNNVS